MPLTRTSTLEDNDDKMAPDELTRSATISGQGHLKYDVKYHPTDEYEHVSTPRTGS